MVTTPQNNIIAEFNKWLYNIVFENKIVVSHRNIWQNKWPGTHVINESISFVFRFHIKPCSETVKRIVGKRSVGLISRGWKSCLDLVKRNYRKSEQSISFDIFTIKGECCNFPGRIMSKVFIGDFSKGPITKQNDFFTILFHSVIPSVAGMV